MLEGDRKLEAAPISQGAKRRRILHRARKEKGAPAWNRGAPEGAFQLLASFSHQRVGSSILASLSEAGGNDLQKVTSKPLPPRLSPFTSRHLKRAYATGLCTADANVELVSKFNKLFILLRLALYRSF